MVTAPASRWVLIGGHGAALGRAAPVRPSSGRARDVRRLRLVALGLRARLDGAPSPSLVVAGMGGWSATLRRKYRRAVMVESAVLSSAATKPAAAAHSQPPMRSAYAALMRSVHRHMPSKPLSHGARQLVLQSGKSPRAWGGRRSIPAPVAPSASIAACSRSHSLARPSCEASPEPANARVMAWLAESVAAPA